MASALLLARLAAPAAAQPETPAYAPRGPAMTFTIAEGDGPQGASRWIAASGQIQRDTPDRFAAFARANPLAGLTLALDSTGGSVASGILLGRMIRAARMQTTVGRTIDTGGRQGFRSADVGCSSSCVLMLMGGTHRSVPSDASVNVHMFSVSLNAEGDRLRPDITLRDVEDAQRGMARLAVFVNAMGVDLRYLELMTQASFKGTPRRLTPEEMKSVNLAEPAEKQGSLGPQSAWVMSAENSPAQALRTLRLTDTGTLTIDHEIALACSDVAGFHTLTYRQILVKAADPVPPIRLARIRLETGGWDFAVNAPQRGLALVRQGGQLWMSRPIPRRVLDDAQAHARLQVEIVPAGGKYPARLVGADNFYEEGFGNMLAKLAKRCDSWPARVTVGPPPRH